MDNDIVKIETKEWDDWVKANPNLVNLDKFLIFNTAMTGWNVYEIGWVEAKKALRGE